MPAISPDLVAPISEDLVPPSASTLSPDLVAPDPSLTPKKGRRTFKDIDPNFSGEQLYLTNPGKILEGVRAAEGVPSYGVMTAAQKYGGDHRKVPEAEGRAAAAQTMHSAYKEWVAAGKSGDFMDFFANKYAPENAQNDPTGLNANWPANVYHGITGTVPPTPEESPVSPQATPPPSLPVKPGVETGVQPPTVPSDADITRRIAGQEPGTAFDAVIKKFHEISLGVPRPVNIHPWTFPKGGTSVGDYNIDMSKTDQSLVQAAAASGFTVDEKGWLRKPDGSVVTDTALAHLLTGMVPAGPVAGSSAARSLGRVERAAGVDRPGLLQKGPLQEYKAVKALDKSLVPKPPVTFPAPTSVPVKGVTPRGTAAVSKVPQVPIRQGIAPDTLKASQDSISAMANDVSGGADPLTRVTGHRAFTSDRTVLYVDNINRDIEALAAKAAPSVKSKEAAKSLDEAIVLYINAKNDPEGFAKFYAGAAKKDPWFAKTLMRMGQMTDEEKVLAEHIADHTRAKGEILKGKGLLKTTQDYHTRQIWEKEPGVGTGPHALGAVSKAERTWNNIAEGIVNGGVLSEDGRSVTRNLHLADASANRAIFTQDLIKSLENSGMGSWGKSEKHPFNLVHDGRVSQPVRNEWTTFERTVGDVQKDKYIHQHFHVNEAGKNFLEKLFPSKPSKIGTLWHQVKTLKVVGGLYHHLQMIENAAYSMGGMGIVPRSLIPGKIYKSMPSVQAGMRAIKEGSPLLDRLQQTGLVLGRNPDEFMNSTSKIFGIPRKTFEAFSGHKALWDVLWRNLKVADAIKTATKVLKKLQAAGATEKEINAALHEVSLAMNDRYGGQFWPGIKVSKEVLDASRKLFFATDWLTSNTRQAISAFQPGLRGNITRVHLAKVITAQLAVASAIQYMWNGNSMFQNESGHEFEIKTPWKDKDGKSYYIPYNVLGVTKEILDVAFAGASAVQDLAAGEPGKAAADIIRPIEGKLHPLAQNIEALVKSGFAAAGGLSKEARYQGERAIPGPSTVAPIVMGQNVGKGIGDIDWLPAAVGATGIAHPSTSEHTEYDPGPSTKRQARDWIRSVNMPEWLQHVLFHHPARPGLPFKSPDLVPPGK